MDELTHTAFQPVKIVSESVRADWEEHHARKLAEGLGPDWVQRMLREAELVMPCAPQTANRLLYVIKDFVKWCLIHHPLKEGKELEKEGMPGEAFHCASSDHYLLDVPNRAIHGIHDLPG